MPSASPWSLSLSSLGNSHLSRDRLGGARNEDSATESSLRTPLRAAGRGVKEPSEASDRGHLPSPPRQVPLPAHSLPARDSPGQPVRSPWLRRPRVPRLS